MQIHAPTIKALTEKYGNRLKETEAHGAVIGYVENVCERILDNTAVFKRDEKGRAAFLRFLNACGYAAK